jgi:hypothetical protein
VDEGGGLKGLPGAFPAEVAGGQAPQFVVDEREQRGKGVFAPLPRAIDELLEVR